MAIVNSLFIAIGYILFAVDVGARNVHLKGGRVFLKPVMVCNGVGLTQ